MDKDQNNKRQSTSKRQRKDKQKDRGIGDYIVKKVFTCTKDQTVFEACNLMAKHNIGTIVIVDKKDKKKPLGIFTERDLVTKVITQHKSSTEMLENVMTRPLVTCSENSDDVKISNLMKKNDIKKVVVTKNRRLAGVVTQTDMIEFLSNSWL